MKSFSLFLSIICLSLAPLLSFSTAQIPDLIIVEGDTLRLFSNPLEDYFNEENVRPKQLVGNGCWSTACWRGYQAIWLLKNDQLFLTGIRSCCFFKTYQINSLVLENLKEKLPENVYEKIVRESRKSNYSSHDFEKLLKSSLKKQELKTHGKTIKTAALKPLEVADLTKLFSAKIIDGKVHADWFSGVLRVPKGKLLNYVHMGYMSTYEFELVVEVEKGDVVGINEYQNTGHRIPGNYGIVNATSFSFGVPKNLIDNKNIYYPNSDTLSISTETLTISGVSSFNKKRLNPEARKQQIANTLDSLQQASSEYKFENYITDITRWGTAGWVDGFDVVKKEFIRIYALANINSQMILIIKSKQPYENFFVTAQNITTSVILMEFSY